MLELKIIYNKASKDSERGKRQGNIINRKQNKMVA